MKGYVYHGSPKEGLKELKIVKEGSHGKKCIYATPNPVLPLIFMGKGRGDLDKDINIDENGKIQLTERRPGIFKELYDKSGYLYTLDGKNFEYYDYLWPLEVISFQDEKILHEKKIENILQQLIACHNNNQIELFVYPNRPMHIPLDNSDLVEKYVNFYKSGKEKAIEELLYVYPELEEQVISYMNKKSRH